MSTSASFQNNFGVCEKYDNSNKLIRSADVLLNIFKNCVFNVDANPRIKMFTTLKVFDIDFSVHCTHAMSPGTYFLYAIYYGV